MSNVERGDNPNQAAPFGGEPMRAHKGGESLRAINRPLDSDDQVDPEEYAKLLDVYDNSFRNIAEGEVVKGTVLKVTPSEVVVDVGYKSEGIIALQEFIDDQGQVTVQPTRRPTVSYV